MTTFPVLRITQVTHIGSLKPSDKGCHGPSDEGHGLSVSQTPAAWTAIAKFGGLPWWRLTNPTAQFLDYHAMTDAQRQQALQWAVRARLLTLETRWKVTYFDEESESTRYIVLKSEEDAQAECEGLDLADAEGNEVMPSPTQQYVATPELVHRMGFAVDDLLAESLGIVCWCETVADFDGVWWADDLAPEHLSAPRGVIFPGKLARWHTTPAEARPFDD